MVNKIEKLSDGNQLKLKSLFISLVSSIKNEKAAQGSNQEMMSDQLNFL
jgi:hypothetical protein